MNAPVAKLVGSSPMVHLLYTHPSSPNPFNRSDSVLWDRKSPDPKSGMPLFFKVGERVKRVFFNGKKVEDLQKLFLERFTDITRHDLAPFLILDKDTKTMYELEDVSDLTPNCIVEMKGPHNLDKKKTYSFGFSGVQRETFVFVMVGLPARGKSYISRKVARYLNWLGITTRVFNVGEYRRKKIGAGQDHSFFDPNNTEAKKARLHMAIAALDDMLNWLHTAGRVAIYDATNSTNERRKLILERCEQEGFQVVFIESLCEDPEIVEKNIRDTKLSSPDYKGQSAEDAIKDFRERIKHYEAAYETITNDSLSYIKMYDVGKRVVVNRINSYLPARVVFFLMNLHISSRPIFMTRHGQSQFNEKGIIGGNSLLTDIGDNYARALSDYIAEQRQQYPHITVWTSTLQRTISTAQYIPLPKVQLRPLDEINAGDFDGMTYDEIAEKRPEEFQQRAANKLRYRYPRGESYEDVIERLEPLIFEVERQRDPVLIVSHQATLRCLYAYFMDLKVEDIPHIPMPLHTVIRLTPRAYGTEETRIRLINDAVVDK